MKYLICGKEYTIEQLKKRLVSVWDVDLLKPHYRKIRPEDAHVSFGHCYITTEFIYHELKDKYQVKVKTIRLDEDTVHWFLVIDDNVIDLTTEQFNFPIDYSQGIGRGLMTKGLSKRGQKLRKLFLEKL